MTATFQDAELFWQFAFTKRVDDAINIMQRLSIVFSHIIDKTVSSQTDNPVTLAGTT